MARSTNGTVITVSIVYSVLVVAAGVVLAVGLSRGSTPLAAAGAGGLIMSGTTAPVALLLAVLVRRVRSAGTVARALTQIQEHSMLSDNAKRVLFRDREVQMLHNAIEDDIARGDHHAAVALCKEMADVFGYREEAEAYRTRIVQLRQRQDELELHAALDQLDAALAERSWAGAYQLAARIRRLYPESHEVTELDLRIARAREQHKQMLEARFLEASDQDDPVTAMELLKELDRYLTRDEAHRLTQTAQGVITRYRDSLSAQFRRAVSEHRWADAAAVGETIIHEYPNSQMATEVRSMIEVLRGRAGAVIG